MESRPHEPSGPLDSASPRWIRSPITPPQDGTRAHNLYSCTPLSYEGVHFSTPVRSRTISSSTPSGGSSSRLPIGSPPRTFERRTGLKARPSVPTGLGLGDLERLASAPSPQADVSREERAHRRRAVHFHSHAQFSEALRLTLARPESVSPEGKDKSPKQRGDDKSPEEHDQDGDEEDFFDDEDFSWEAASPSSIDTPALRSSSMHDLAAAFPSPPKTAPEFPLSLFSLERDTPPHLPLPPTPPFLRAGRSPHVYASAGYADNRMTVIDPNESMARLEMSVAKLEGFGPVPDAPGPPCFFDDDNDEMEEMQLHSEQGRNVSEEGTAQEPLAEDISSHLADTSPLSNPYSPEIDTLGNNSPGLEDDVDGRLERLLRCLSPSNLTHVGPPGSGASMSSSSTAPSPHTPSASSPMPPPPLELLPQFDFEKTRRYHDQGRSHRRRSSSMSNTLNFGWQPFVATDADVRSRLQPGTAGPRASSSTDASSASAYSSVPTSSFSASSSGHARNSSAEYRSLGIQTQLRAQPERPESPLRKARSTPFIRRPMRYEPAQPFLQQHRRIAPPLPPLPSPPPLPPVPPANGPLPLPGSLGLARSLTHSPSTPREAERARAARSAHPSPHGHAGSPASSPWAHVRRAPDASPAMMSPSSSRVSGIPSPRTPPNDTAKGQSSFMHITPEQPHSRMSRLWSRARAGLGKSPEEGKPCLKKEKSGRWLRGSVVQARGE